MHRGLVGDRALVGRDYLADAKLRQEYARDIAPRTGAALGKILAEVFQDVPPPRRAIDLGAGTGAATAALRTHFGPPLEVVGVDRVPSPGLIRADLAVELPPVTSRFDLIVAAHLLNELYVERPLSDQVALRARRVRAWAAALLAPGGTIILLEPALRETSRALLAVRDALKSTWEGADPAVRGELKSTWEGPGSKSTWEGGLDVVAPCFWRGGCPALAQARDWCHDAAPVPSSPRVDFSYLVLRDRPPVDPGDRYRVVSDPLPEKGRLKLYACGPAGRHPFVRLDRHASPANARFGELRRGDVAQIKNAEPAGDGLRVLETTVVSD
jgi:ribosomal protein RSM22 (predicted rRNA methylase)